MSNITTSGYCGEIIQSNLSNWRAQCWKLHSAPLFGSLVCVDSEPYMLYGIVYQISTGSLEAGRVPTPYQKTYPELRAEYPHIFELLSTSFDCCVVGYRVSTSSAIIFTVPPHPARIHAFVGPVPPTELTTLLHPARLLPLLWAQSSTIPLFDELLLAFLRILSENPDKLHLFEQFFDQFALLAGTEYRRLRVLLARAEKFI